MSSIRIPRARFDVTFVESPVLTQFACGTASSRCATTLCPGLRAQARVPVPQRPMRTANRVTTESPEAGNLECLLRMKLRNGGRFAPPFTAGLKPPPFHLLARPGTRGLPAGQSAHRKALRATLLCRSSIGCAPFLRQGRRDKFRSAPQTSGTQVISRIESLAGDGAPRLAREKKISKILISALNTRLVLMNCTLRNFAID